MGKIRTFIAVDVEDEKLKFEFIKFQKKLQDIGADVKLITPENMHLTLRFLGEIEENEIQRVITAMRKLKFEPFDIQFDKAGSFPSLSRINVVWVGISNGFRELEQISKKLEHELMAIGVPSDKKGFSPHLTIARVRSSRNKEQIALLINELSEKNFGSMKAESVRLKKSILMPSGPIYSTIFEVKAGNSIRY